MHTNSFILGLDFGSQYLSMATMRQRCFALKPFPSLYHYPLDDNFFMRNEVYINSIGESLVGQIASRHSYNVGSGFYFHNYRKLVEANEPLFVNGLSLLPSDLATTVIRSFLKTVKVIEGDSIASLHNVIASVPAWVGLPYRQRINDIINILWKEIFNQEASISFCDDSVAVLMSVLHNNNILLSDIKDESRFLIIDSDDFNFHVSLVEINNGYGKITFDVLNCSGDADLSTTQYESFILSFILNKRNVKLDSYRERSDFMRIMQCVHNDIKLWIEDFDEAKQLHHNLVFEWFNGDVLEVSFNNKELYDFIIEQGINPLDTMLKYTNDCINQSKIKSQSISAIIFSGSILSMPYLRSRFIDKIEETIRCGGLELLFGKFIGNKSEGAALLGL